MQSLGQLSYLLSGTRGPHWCHPNPTFMCFSTTQLVPPPLDAQSPSHYYNRKGRKAWPHILLKGARTSQAQPS